MKINLHMSKYILLILLSSILVDGELMVPDQDDDGDVGSKSSKSIFNFASQAAGAVVLDKSPNSAKGKLYVYFQNDLYTMKLFVDVMYIHKCICICVCT
jgi:hypothetical protein